MKRVKPRFVWYQHTLVLAAVLQRVADGELNRVMVFMPPRHGKSEEVSRLFSAYFLYRHPERFVGINSYSQDLANTLSRAARENYKAGGGKTKSDADAVRQWETPSGGGLWAAGVGGPITGKGFHLGIIDDPLKNAEEAASETIRKNQQEWYQSTFYTREEPGGAIVVVQTRWHEMDLSGWLLQEESEEEPEHWHIVNFAAIAEPMPTFPATCTHEADWRQEGEPLCPERYSAEKLQKIEKRVGAYFWSSLYRQRPSPPGGSFFDKAWFRSLPVAPVCPRYVRYWDLAGAKPGKGDWTVGVLMGVTPDKRFCVIDIQRFQKPSNERDTVIQQIARSDRQEFGGKVKTYIEQAPGLAKEATDALVRLLSGFVVEADPAHRDKITRAEPYKSQVMAGNVDIVDSENVRAFLDVHQSFPFGDHDDDVDAASGAFKKLTTPGEQRTAINPADYFDLRK